jgi:phenylacetate-CoA ligase
MDKSYLKFIRDNIPESLFILTAPIVRNELIKNKIFRDYYSLLVKREGSDAGKIREYQFNELKKILIYSYKYVPFYTDLFNRVSFKPAEFSDLEEMEKIPFLTRKIILENHDRLKSSESVKNGYYTGSTGGSTGLPLKFLLDYDSVFIENAFIYYYRRKLGYNFKDRMVTFRQCEIVSRLWRHNPIHNEMTFYPIKISKATIAEYVRKINEYKPVYLNGYLSAIWYFARLIEEYKMKLTIKLKGIFLISENVDDQQREFLEQFFNAKTSAFYGHSERCVIAEEIKPYLYSFDPYYGYTELIKSESNRYTIVGTGFLNHIMPLIRYKTDDICSMSDNLFSIEGKRSSTIGLYGHNNEFMADTSLELDDHAFNKIITYQFIQEKKGEADLLIIVSKDFKMSDLPMMKKVIDNQTKGFIDINIKIVDHLILSQRGKYQPIISNIGKVNKTSDSNQKLSHPCL